MNRSITVDSRQKSSLWVNPVWRGTILMMLATLCLSNASILSKFIYREQVGLYTMLSLRFMIAAFLLWVFYLGVKGWRPLVRPQSRRHLANCILVGMTNSVSQMLFYIGLIDLDPGLSMMIFSLNPALVALMLLFLGEALTRLKMARIALGLGGLYFLTVAGGMSGQNLNPWAVLPVIGSALFYGLHLVLYQKLLPNTNSRTNTLYILTTMALIYLVLTLVSPGYGPAAYWHVSGTAWTYLLIMAVIATVFARLLMFTGVGLIGGTQVALIGIGEPVIVLVSSIFLLNEQLSPAQWFGTALVITSIALAGFNTKGMLNKKARLVEPGE